MPEQDIKIEHYVVYAPDGETLWDTKVETNDQAVQACREHANNFDPNWNPTENGYKIHGVATYPIQWDQLLPPNPNNQKPDTNNQ